jgi:predicted PurR-regulated permease PerM
MAASREEHNEKPPEVTADDVRAETPGRGRVHFEPQHLYKGLGLLFLLALFFRFFDTIAHVLLLLFAAAIVATVLNPVVKRIPLNRMASVAIIGLLIFGILFGLIWLGGATIANQIGLLAQNLPAYEEQLRTWEGQLQDQTGIELELFGEDAGATVQNFLLRSSGTLLGNITGIIGVLAIPLLVLIGGFYALALPNHGLLQPFMRTVPEDRQPAFYRMMHLVGERIGGWFRGRLLAMVGVAILSISALLIIGVPYALLLGLLVGLLEFIPLLGPVLGGAIAAFIALFDDPMKALWVVVAMTIIQQVESNVITPWAMSSQAEVHPLLTLFSLVLFGGMFGFLGVLLALPLVLLFGTVFQVLWVERTIHTDRKEPPPVVET